MKSRDILVFIALTIASCTEAGENNSRVDVLPFYDEATFTPHWIQAGDESLETFHRISPFKLINQEGDSITEETFKDKIYVVDFFFTTCGGICPKMTANMSGIQKAFLDEDDVMLLSHSVTPDADSVSVLKRYAESQNIITNKWHITTGNRADIYKLGRDDYFIEEDLGLEKDDDDFLHTENFVIIDKNKHIRGIYNGLNKTSVKQLIADVRTLQKE